MVIDGDALLKITSKYTYQFSRKIALPLLYMKHIIEGKTCKTYKIFLKKK